MRYMLSRRGLSNVKINLMRGRIVVESDDPEKASHVLSKMFGVAFAMPVVEVKANLDDIAKVGVRVARKTVGKGDSFAVRARRVGKHPFNSRQLEKRIGRDVLEGLDDVRVDLDHPDRTIYVEVRENVAYVGVERTQGPGGLPLGSQGKVVSLLSGSVESTVATWMMMKRGAIPILVYLDFGPYASEKAYERVRRAARLLREVASVADFRLFTVPFGGVITKFVEKAPKKLTCVLCKRSMYAIGHRLAVERGALAIVTGERLERASWTLTNLHVLDVASMLPVFRPLVGLNEEEAMKLGLKLGLREEVEETMASCKVAPGKPVRANLQTVLNVEARFNVKSLIDDAIRGAREEII
jgi:thiamine biosynthesis protein ThiI